MLGKDGVASMFKNSFITTTMFCSLLAFSFNLSAQSDSCVDYSTLKSNIKGVDIKGYDFFYALDQIHHYNKPYLFRLPSKEEETPPDYQTIENKIKVLKEGELLSIPFLGTKADPYIRLTEQIINGHPEYKVMLFAENYNKKDRNKKEYILTVINPYGDFLGKFLIEDPLVKQYSNSIKKNAFKKYFFNNTYSPEKFKLLIGAASSNQDTINSERYIIASSKLSQVTKERIKKEYKDTIEFTFGESLYTIQGAPKGDLVLAELAVSSGDQYKSLKDAIKKALELVESPAQIRISWAGDQGAENYKKNFKEIVYDFYHFFNGDVSNNNKNPVETASLWTIPELNHYLIIINLAVSPYDEDLFGGWEKYRGKTVLSFGEGNVDKGSFIYFLNKHYNARGYGLDYFYKKTDLDKKEVLQDVTVPTEEFLKIKKVIPNIDGGVDYVVGRNILNGIAYDWADKTGRKWQNEPSWNKSPKTFAGLKVKQALLNAIDILKVGGEAAFNWFHRDHRNYLDENGKEIFGPDLPDDHYRLAVTSIFDEVKKERPNVILNLKNSSFDGEYTITSFNIKIKKISELKAVKQETAKK